jgi:hypothetical protein
MRRSTLAAIACSVILGAACAAGGIRPSYEPFPEARVDTVNAAPPAVIQEVAARVNAENMRPNFTSPEEGYLETQWFDVVAQRSGVTDRSNADRIVLLRFWADSLEGGRTRLTSEAVVKGNPDPSLLPRDQEMHVAPGHAGARILERVIDGTQERFGR